MNQIDQQTITREEIVIALERDLKLISALLHAIRCDQNVFNPLVDALYDKYTKNTQNNG